MWGGSLDMQKYQQMWKKKWSLKYEIMASAFKYTKFIESEKKSEVQCHVYEHIARCWLTELGWGHWHHVPLIQVICLSYLYRFLVNFDTIMVKNGACISNLIGTNTMVNFIPQIERFDNMTKLRLIWFLICQHFEWFDFSAISSCKVSFFSSFQECCYKKYI